MKKAVQPIRHLNIPSLRPADTPEYMTEAWLSCICWAIGEDKIVAEFRKDTGNNWQPSRNGIEQMIDSATGVDLAFIEAFIKWANVKIWGPLDNQRVIS